MILQNFQAGIDISKKCGLMKMEEKRKKHENS